MNFLKPSLMLTGIFTGKLPLVAVKLDPAHLLDVAVMTVIGLLFTKENTTLLTDLLGFTIMACGLKTVLTILTETVPTTKLTTFVSVPTLRILKTEASLLETRAVILVSNFISLVVNGWHMLGFKANSIVLIILLWKKLLRLGRQ